MSWVAAGSGGTEQNRRRSWGHMRMKDWIKDDLLLICRVIRNALAILGVVAIFAAKLGCITVG